jgi:hypothetical protein
MSTSTKDESKRFDFWLAAAFAMYFAWGIGWICYLSYRAIKGIP